MEILDHHHHFDSLDFNTSFFNNIKNECGIFNYEECLKPNIVDHGLSTWDEKSSNELSTKALLG